MAILREQCLPVVLLLILVALLLPGGPMVSGLSLSHAAPPTAGHAAAVPSVHGATVSPPSPASTNVYGNSSVETTDSSVVNNTGLNFTVSTGTYDTIITMAISLPAGANLTVLAYEPVYTNATLHSTNSTYIGFDATNVAGTGTKVYPEAVLPTNHSVIIDTSNPLTQGTTALGSWDFRLVHTGGDFWAFKANDQLIVPTHGGNGTYNLSANHALGYTSRRGGPQVEVEQMGATGTPLPFTSAQASFLLSPAIETNNTAAPTGPHLAADGIYESHGAVNGLIPMIGANQTAVTSFKIPGDIVLVNPSSTVTSLGVKPTNTSGTCLWGDCPPGPAPPTVTYDSWLTAYTQEASFNNLTAVSFTETTPTSLPTEGFENAYSNEITVPVNGTEDLALGYIELDISVSGFLTEEGAFPFLITYDTVTGEVYQEYFNADPTTSATANLTIQHSSSPGWWWSMYVNGVANNTGWENGDRTAMPNGTFLLNTSTFWGTTQLPLSISDWGGLGFGLPVELLSTTVPTLGFYGNTSSIGYKTFNQTIGFALGGPSGWGVPTHGVAWSWYYASAKAGWAYAGDVMAGGSEWTTPWLTAGSVIVAQAPLATTPPHSVAAPLQNLTTVWTTIALTATATPTSVYSGSGATGGGSLTFNVEALYLGKGISGATLTSTCADALGLGSCGTWTVGASAGNYTLPFTATTPVHAAIADSITLELATLDGVGWITVPFTIVPAVNVTANTLQGGAGTATVAPGGSVTVNIWTNQSGKPVSVGAVEVSGSEATACSAPTMVSTGYYTCLVTYSSKAAATTYDLSVAEAPTPNSGVNTATASVEVKVTSLPLSISPITLSPSEPSGGFAAGAWVNFSVTATSSGTDVAGVAVVFSLSPTVAGATLTATTNSQGVATVEVEFPNNLASATTYTLSVTSASATGYASPSSSTLPSTTFTVNVPTSPSTSSSSGLPLIDLALVGVVVVVVIALVALMMMRKKKSSPPPGQTPPQQWSPVEQPGAPGGMPPEQAPPS